MSNGWKIFIVAASGLLTCLLVAVGIYAAREGKASASTTTEALTQTFAKYQDMELAMYDGLGVSGAEVSSLIRSVNEQDDYVAIGVNTKAMTADTYAYYNRTYTSGTLGALGSGIELAEDDVSEASYLNPSATFLGSIERDSNGTLIAVRFVQQ